MMVLIGVATSVAYLYSSAVVFGLRGKFFFWELATLIVVMLLGHWIEMKSVMSASKALESLAKLMPSTVHRITSEGKIEEVSLKDLRVGDRVLVRPGEKVPSDGIILKGQTSVNESILTGESSPVFKKEKDKVIGGSVNGEGAIEIEILHTGRESYLAQVIKIIQEAQRTKSKTQDLANRAARWLTIISLSLGTLTLGIWIVLTKDFAFAIERMVTVMVITCPHALGLSVPLVVARSTSLAAKNGLLIRERRAFEKAKEIDVVLFDKTGTLTKGEFGVSEIIASQNYSRKDILQIAASLELNSEHPLAKAIVKEAKKENIDLLSVEKFLSLPGKGIQGEIQGKTFRVVGDSYLKDNQIKVDNLFNAFKSKKGRTFIYLLEEQTPVGAIALSDIIKRESKEAVERLKEMGIRVMMVTGDNEDVARWVSEKLNLDGFFANVLPEKKYKIVKKLQSERLKVAMVGDGVNDAPALTQADVGIAIGAGTDVAIESADIILTRSDPRDIVAIIGLSRSTLKKMKENLFWATGYNVIAIPIAAGILYKIGILLNPAVGAMLMSLSTVIVSLNAQNLKDPKAT